MIPNELKIRLQWIVWRSEPRPGSDKRTKVPYSPVTFRHAKSTDPTTWGSFDVAIAEYQRGSFDGVGYVFTEADGFTGVDLDHCCDAHGVLQPWALDIVQTLDSYTEWSPSNRGVHVIIQGRLPKGGRRKGKVEMYDSARYFTMTGSWVPVTPRVIEERQAALEALHARVFPRQEKREQAKRSSSPVQCRDDEELLRRAMRAKNGDKFSALWQGNFSSEYPSQSEADLALCNFLAFWTDGDSARIDRLFRSSGLYREKWDARHYADGRTYGQATVARALR